MAFVHTRILCYKKKDINPVVLNFRADNSYDYEGVKVLCLKDYKEKYKDNKIELLITHAPNLKNHLSFIKKYNKNTNKILMFFHGHEVLKTSNYYPKSYSYTKNKKIKRIVRNAYDRIKLPVLRKNIKRYINEKKINLVFVSEWMYDHFHLNTGLTEKETSAISLIISNSVNEAFIEKSYENKTEKIADFVTIRPLDESKYGIDIVRNLAIENPKYTFHIYGKGKYFEHNSLPNNMTLYQDFIRQNKIPEVLNKYKVALMPTRLDAQGVMACEIATYEMPMITSEIPICKEIFSEFENVFYMNNETLEIDLERVLNYTPKKLNKTSVYLEENTIQKEIDLIKNIKS